jgi:hypothetical protein
MEMGQSAALSGKLDDLSIDPNVKTIHQNQPRVNEAMNRRALHFLFSVLKFCSTTARARPKFRRLWVITALRRRREPNWRGETKTDRWSPSKRLSHALCGH